MTTWKTLDPASIDLPWEQVMSSNKRNIHLGEQPILMLSISGEKTKQNAERGIFLPYTLRSHGLGKNIHSLTEQALKQSRNLSPKFTFSCRQSMGQQLPPALETEGYGDILCSGQRSEVTVLPSRESISILGLRKCLGNPGWSFRHERTGLSIRGNITEEGTQGEGNILLVFVGRGSTAVLWELLKCHYLVLKQLSNVALLKTYLHKYNHKYISFALFHLLNCKHVNK